MDSIEAEGHSIDDAIERALQRLGVGREKVDIEIVSNATRGLFGLGGKRARVRATLRRSAAFDAAPDAGSAAEPGREGKRATGEWRAVGERPARAPARRRAAAASTAAVERARTVLQELVRLTGVEGAVTVAHDGEAVRLVIEGDPSGVLIGRRGQTLDAIEYLVNRIAGHDEDGGARLVVDSQDYRARRRQALEALAQRLAERARRRGKPVTLNPMSPRDRRIVHLALQDDPALTTRSAGTGYYRKLVIVPEGTRRR